MGNNLNKEDGNQVKSMYCFADHKEGITCMAISEDQSLIATGSDDMTIRMWSTKSLDPGEMNLGVMRGHEGYITCLSISDTFVVSGSADNTVRKWDMTTCECVCTYKGHSNRIMRLLCTGDLIFSSSLDRTAKAWEFDTSDKLDESNTVRGCFRTFEGHNRAVIPMIFIPALGGIPQSEPGLNINSGDLLFTGSMDGVVLGWDLDSGKKVKAFQGHTDGIITMSTDPQGKLLITGSNDHTLKIWLISTTNLLKTFDGHTDGVLSIIVPNSKIVYSGGADGKVICWALDYGDKLRTFKACNQGYAITAIKLYKGHLVAASSDNQIRAFKLDDQMLEKVFHGHEGAVNSIAIVDGRMYSGSTDGTIRVWDTQIVNKLADDENEMTMMRSRQNRNLELLDRRLNGYFQDEVDTSSVPDIV